MKIESEDEYLPTRESLLNRLRNWDDQASWKDFFETYWKMIYRVGRRAGLSDAEAQDVVQETIITVARRLPQFRYDPAIGSFKSWLLTLTRSRLSDHFRKKHYHRHGQQLRREEPLSTSLLEAHPDSEAAHLDQVWNEEWRQNIMDKAVERVKLAVSPKQYQMFYFHALKGLPARQVAQRLNTNLAEIYVAKYKVSALLKKQIRALEESLL
jgi:RNA polymerase sigma-70 factor (ECF subfamily)